MTITNTAAAKALIDSQAAKGLSKYGVPLEQSDATISQLARHGAEEAADLLCYLIELERRALEMEADLRTCRNAKGLSPSNTGAIAHKP